MFLYYYFWYAVNNRVHEPWINDMERSDQSKEDNYNWRVSKRTAGMIAK